MKQSASKAIIGIGAIAIAYGIASGVCSMSWFTSQNDIAPAVSAASRNAYFAGGNGTKTNPFILNNPVHYYNLCWLQYLGQFNRDTDLDGVINQVYFKLNGNLDMSTSWATKILPPVGTAKFPFIGHFDGNGHTIENLTVSNNSSPSHYSSHPFSVKMVTDVDSIGVFGVAGTENDDLTTAPSLTSIGSVVNATYDPTLNSIQDLGLSGITIEASSADNSAGIGVGYDNATLSHVGVGSGCKISVLEAGTGTSNVSDYSLVGKAADSKLTSTGGRTDETYVPNVDNPNNIAGGTGFGSSIDMQTMYNFLHSMKTSDGSGEVPASTNATMPQEIRVYSGENISPSTLTKDNYKNVACEEIQKRQVPYVARQSGGYNQFATNAVSDADGKNYSSYNFGMPISSGEVPALNPHSSSNYQHYEDWELLAGEKKLNESTAYEMYGNEYTSTDSFGYELNFPYKIPCKEIIPILDNKPNGDDDGNVRMLLRVPSSTATALADSQYLNLWANSKTVDKVVTYSVGMNNRSIRFCTPLKLSSDEHLLITKIESGAKKNYYLSYTTVEESGTTTGGLYFNRTKKLTVLN